MPSATLQMNYGKAIISLLREDSTIEPIVAILKKYPISYENRNKYKTPQALKVLRRIAARAEHNLMLNALIFYLEPSQHLILWPNGITIQLKNGLKITAEPFNDRLPSGLAMAGLDPKLTEEFTDLAEVKLNNTMLSIETMIKAGTPIDTMMVILRVNNDAHWVMHFKKDGLEGKLPKNIIDALSQL